MMLSRHFHTTRRDCLYMKIIILLIISVQIIMANICTFAKKSKGKLRKPTNILKKIKNRFYKTLKRVYFEICKFAEYVQIFVKYDCNLMFC